jgi:hypothetical protein
MSSPLSQEAEAFLTACVNSILELDVVLVLQNDDARWWNADQVAAEMRIGMPLAAAALEALAARNLLDVRIGGSLTYRFAPLEDRVRTTTQEISRNHYAARELIVARRQTRTAAERFAAAFKLRKEDG